MNEISRTRKELSFANKKLAARGKVGSAGGKENQSLMEGSATAEDI